MENKCIITVDNLNTGTVTIVLEDERGTIPIARYDMIDKDIIRIRKIVAKLSEYERIINYIRHLE